MLKLTAVTLRLEYLRALLTANCRLAAWLIQLLQWAACLHDSPASKIEHCGFFPHCHFLIMTNRTLHLLL